MKAGATGSPMSCSTASISRYGDRRGTAQAVAEGMKRFPLGHNPETKSPVLGHLPAATLCDHDARQTRGWHLSARGPVMDLSSLGSLGKIAGIAGIAIGMIVLLVRPIIERTSALPVADRAPTFRLLALGAFAIGALGIVAWLVSGLSVGNVNVTAGPGGQAAGHDMSGNTITTVAPQGATAPPAATPAAKQP
jgi:hypothetical protein